MLSQTAPPLGSEPTFLRVEIQVPAMACEALCDLTCGPVPTSWSGSPH